MSRNIIGFESSQGPGSGACGFYFAVVGHGACSEGDQQYPDSRGNPVHGVIEGLLIDLGRFRESGDLSHELQRGPLDLGFRGRRIEIVQGLDVSTHVRWPPCVLIYRLSADQAIRNTPAGVVPGKEAY